jgi:transcriptional regulator with XRE-family HTH domain
VKFDPYHPDMARPISKPRPRQGAHLSALRKTAGLSQAELALKLNVPQSNVAYWETSEKPPRSDVLPAMAQALRVKIEDILNAPAITVRKPGPVGKLQRAMEQAASLPRRQQQLIVDFVNTLAQNQRKAG